jgi:hypothetical protein
LDALHLHGEVQPHIRPSPKTFGSKSAGPTPNCGSDHYSPRSKATGQWEHRLYPNRHCKSVASRGLYNNRGVNKIMIKVWARQLYRLGGNSCNLIEKDVDGEDGYLALLSCHRLDTLLTGILRSPEIIHSDAFPSSDLVDGRCCRFQRYCSSLCGLFSRSLRLST